MKRNILAIVLIVLSLSTPAFARVTQVEVTKANQQDKQLEISVNVLKMSDKMYSVRFSAPRTGKLQKFRSASLTLYNGDQLILSAPLREMAEDTEQEIATQFSVDKELLDKCVLNLLCSDIMIHTSYNIRVATYLPGVEP